MEQQHFNQWDFSQAISQIEENPLESKSRFETYLQKYPKDYSTYCYYASALIMLGQFNEAEKVLNNVEIAAKKDADFYKLSDRVKHFEKHLLLHKVKLLSYQERFEELYQLYIENSKELDSMNINYLIFYCKKKVGKLGFCDSTKLTYLYSQIIDYQENRFLEHIKKHLADYYDPDNPNNNVFSSDFPIDEIIEEIKKYIPHDKRKICLGYAEDEYIFKYDNCGRDNNKLVDYFKVICFHNSDNFITICPVQECKNLPYIDLNYLNLDNKKNKVRRISQKEKFQNRMRNYMKKN